MPRRSAPLAAPRAWMTEGTWPDGEIDPDAPAAVPYAVHVSKTLGEALAGRNKSEVALAAEIERSTLYDLLAGNKWPELFTIAKLELELGVSLWPDQPLPKAGRAKTSKDS
ncbi:XRE family transcriptional regulator [Nocardioides sp. IC4_145]|uniref:XRE family transcriptional regulator n=1 Tax=Nocardioides sp. IC4_145 TaxID=2714037 RepID=UPI0014082B64|nr:XRE family transcriptional regulator [Nocardioides sp. IC4_145]NHC21859.1 XRE family transcriptional regulator [Nocardioides sp. IC4_145]